MSRLAISDNPLIWAARYIRATPASWFAAAVPSGIASALSLLFGFFAVRTFSPWLANALSPEGEAWRFVWHIVRWLSLASGVYAGLLASLWITPALSAPALERLVRLTEETVDAPPRRAQGFWFELTCGLRAQLALVVVTLPIALALWLLGWILPLLSPIVLILQSILLGLAVSWNLLDYPLTLRGIGYQQRWGVASRNAGTLLAFGLPFAALFWIPGLGIVLLPVGVVAATRILWTQLILDPELAKLLQYEPLETPKSGANSQPDEG